jgi:hypothetical protein
MDRVHCFPVAARAPQLVLLVCLLLSGCSSSDDSASSGPAPGDDASAVESPQQESPSDKEPNVPVIATELPQDEAVDFSQLPQAQLLLELVSDDPSVRDSAHDQLAAAPPSVEQLVEVWRGGNREQRRGAAFFAMGIYRGVESQIENAAIDSLKDEDGRVRGLALELVRRFPQALLLPLRDQLCGMLNPQQETDEKNRSAVARLLGGWPLDRELVGSALSESVVGDPQPRVRSAALISICRISDEAPLIELLQKVIGDDRDPSLRRLAIVRLGRLGRSAAASAPLIAASLEDTDEAVADAAARALTLLGPAALPKLVGMLESPSDSARRLAAFALGTLGKEAGPAVPALKKLLDDPEQEVREVAKWAIENIVLRE